MIKITHFTNVQLNYIQMKNDVKDALELQNIYFQSKLLRQSASDNIPIKNNIILYYGCMDIELTNVLACDAEGENHSNFSQKFRGVNILSCII